MGPRGREPLPPRAGPRGRQFRQHHSPRHGPGHALAPLPADLRRNRANGPALISLLQTAIEGLEANDPKGPKLQRAWAAQPAQHSGNVWLPRHAPWAPAFVDELRRFPRASYDDQVDAYAQAMDRFTARQAVRPSAGVVVSIRRPPPPLSGPMARLEALRRRPWVRRGPE